MSQLLIGSICLSNIPRSEMKKIKCKDGVERIFLNVAVVERKDKSQFGDTHFITCAPKKEERKEGINYIFGDLKVWNPEPQMPTAEEIAAAPPFEPQSDNDLPF
jgi:hypothetical protein